MEASSPLAALHRPSPAPVWGGSRDIFRPRMQSHCSSSSASLASVSLREQLHKSTSDYFGSVKEVRGSSPAASLAADLSQNFRLDNDASPQFPTPRRALFTANMMGGLEGRQFVTTPPPPSSSPGHVVEYMELSPLPHKTPFFSQVEEVGSPTPGSTPAEDNDNSMALDSPAPITRQVPLEPAKSFFADRRIAAPRRPSLTRMKGLSTNSMPGRAQSDRDLPPFRFGVSSAITHTSSNLSLGECFESASPTQDERPQSSNSPCAPVPLPPRARAAFGFAGSGSASRFASPSNCHSRRQSNPFLRNRKQVRRSLSMFEHPADVMKAKPDIEGSTPSSTLKSVMDIEEVHEPVLPHFLPDDPTDSIPRISCATLLDVLDGKYADNFAQKMVIDCRFEYEYDGGHIEGAVNHNDKELLANQLFDTPMTGRSLLIFHCEYSAHRAPLMARHVRAQDRTANAEYYPKLTYPEVYILDGGYSGFFAEHRGRCYPPEYVEMSDEKHQRTCEREMGRLKARKGLGRSQTFAFGQREACVNDSPTAPGRPSSREAPTSMYSYSPLAADRSHTRRMASY